MSLIQRLKTGIVKKREEAKKAITEYKKAKAEEKETFRKAREAEKVRVGTLEHQKRIEKAKEAGVRSIHKKEILRKKVEALKSEARKEKERLTPALKQLLKESSSLIEKQTRPSGRPRSRVGRRPKRKKTKKTKRRRRAERWF